MHLRRILSNSHQSVDSADGPNRLGPRQTITLCPWTSLFAFTKKTHVGILLAALAAAACVAFLRTILSVLLGRIFGVISQLGDESRSGQSATAEISKYCIILVGLGFGNWVANSSFLTFWMIFGELQVIEVRKEVTSCLLSKNIEWFGHLKDGLEGLHIRINTQTHDLQSALSKVLVAASSLSGIDIVQVFSGSGREKRLYGRALRLAARHFVAQARCNSIQRGYVAFWSMSIFVLGFWYGLGLIEQGLSPGYVVTTFFAVITALHGFESFASHWLVLSKGKSAAQFLRNLARPEQVSDASGRYEGHVELHTCAGNLQLDQANAKHKIVKGVTMKIPPGQLTFLVGDSGSGKSTLCSLMANLLTPIAGDVLIDGCSIDQIQPGCLSRHVLLIDQTSCVINDSLFNNVAFGSTCPQNVSATEVQQACAFAKLESTVSQLHSGLATIVGSKNPNLSGGQRQRLALSRAWIRDPAILILDEPTSALDPASQILIMNAIREWRKDKTTIIVTHDMSNIRDEDFVFIIESGMINRQGRMRDLQDAASVPLVSLRRSTSDQAGIEPASNRLNRYSKTRTYALTEVPKTYLQRAASSSCSFQIKGMRKSFIDGWHIADDLSRKQQQFSAYLDRHFCTADPSFSLEGPKTREESEFVSRQRSGSSIFPSDSSSTDGSSMTMQVDCKNDIANIEKQTTPPDAPPCDSVRVLASTIWTSLGLKDRLCFFLALLLCLISAASTPVFSFCLAKLMGAMWSRTDKLQQGLRWAMYLIGIAITDGVCTGGGHFLFEKISQIWVDRLRQDILGKVLDQPRLLRCHVTRDITKQLNRCLDRNAEEMRIIMSKLLPVSLVAVAILGISISWAMTMCWKLALVALAPLPLFVLAIKMYVGVSSKWENKSNEAASDSSATLEDVLLNSSFIRAFGLGPYFDGKQSTTAKKAWQVGLRRALYASPWFGLYQSITLPLIALIFYYATSLISQQTRDIGINDIVQVVNLLLFSIGTSLELLNGLPQLTAARVTATELLRYTKVTINADASEGTSVRPDSPLPVQMRSVNLTAAQTSTRILRDISCDINPGSFVAIVGPSGSGKTTMLSLLLGLTTPDISCKTNDQAPEIPLRFGGIPYPVLDMQHVRSKMAYVPQQPFLFPATIRDNIAYGISTACPMSVQEVVTQAAKASGIHDFIISLPDGYDTVVGDGGQALSGGQAQLVNIARALARRPRLIILDEPSSALDPESAAHVRETLALFTQSPSWQQDGMAVIVATHSIEMMRMATEILVLNEGFMVEQGTYGDLMARRRHLWRLVNQPPKENVFAPNDT
ncbi:hypothetical protein E4U56_004077 [Claviceps arundinis]|uniref:ABC a-pheromone efflux pump AtrD n=1 Tax=Claviceps arundinis TaxID=1623583 RepID=A0A9P7MN69_9HYPO|nr:hypothetical protein E4U56_004077 [Claviceps arundinis]